MQDVSRIREECTHKTLWRFRQQQKCNKTVRRRNREEHASVRWLCQVRNYSPRERTLRATLECCNTIECHVRASEFLPNDQKEMELRASIKELGGRYPLPMHQTIPMLMKHHDEIRGYEESVGNEL
ncbi:hypothetical protein V6N12_068207 [Hibiscus sabdariffa]|uniref:Uncharacterized protein n=1 Tax=Hibiscus sabdariffa TaxID=183260 RepID=A0ABR2FPN1_9ROSI